jgi:excisionase family DNA binding protein
MFSVSDVLTVDEAARELKMHLVTVRKLLRNGQLPGGKVGPRQWRISAAALKAFIEGKRAAPKSARR